MNREKAIEILDFPRVERNILIKRGIQSFNWYPTDRKAQLSGYFTPEQLKALAWWMEEYGDQTAI